MLTIFDIVLLKTIMFSTNYDERWNRSPVVRKYTEDPLEWQLFINRQRKEHPNSITLDYSIGTKYESAFIQAAKMLGFSTSVIDHKRIDYAGSRGECTMDASLIEIRFSKSSITDGCTVN